LNWGEQVKNSIKQKFWFRFKCESSENGLLFITEPFNLHRSQKNYQKMVWGYFITW